MFTVGTVAEKSQKLIDTCKKALDIGIAEVRPGNFFGNIGFDDLQIINSFLSIMAQSNLKYFLIY